MDWQLNFRNRQQHSGPGSMTGPGSSIAGPGSSIAGTGSSIAGPGSSIAGPGTGCCTRNTVAAISFVVTNRVIIYIYIYTERDINIWLQSFRLEMLMIKSFDHKTTFPDTHRHFRLAIEISQKCPIACRGLELKRATQKTTCLDSQPMFLERKKRI